MHHKTKLTWKEADRLISISTKEITSDRICAEPLVSVCLITYNHRKFIHDSVDSVLAQITQFPFEVVISDDCSSDGTTDIVLDYQRVNPDKIRVLLAKETLGKHTGNGRLNFIRTLRTCRGKYIALLEGDDYWTAPQKLQKQVEFLESHPEYAGAFHDTSVLEADGAAGDPKRWWQDFGDRLDATHEDTISINTPFHTSSFVLRRENIANLPAVFLQFGSGDLPIYILSAARGPLRRISMSMSVWRNHDGGISKTSAHRAVGGALQKRFMMCALRKHLYPIGKDRFNEAIEEYNHQLFSLWNQSRSVERLALLQAAWANCERRLAREIVLSSIHRKATRTLAALRRRIFRRA